MENIIFQKESIQNIVDLMKIFFICFYTYYTNLRITNKRISIIKITYIFIIAIIAKILEKSIGNVYAIISMVILISIICNTKESNNFPQQLLITNISLSINYILFFLSILLTFIPVILINIQNEYITLIIMICIYSSLIIYVNRIKKFKKGLIFLKDKLKNEFVDILVINISIIILFIVILLSSYKEMITSKLMMGLIIFCIIMFFTIKEALQLYYKQKMLVKDLEETKTELEEKNNRIKELEKEIIKSGKRSHSISHRQDILEHKLEELSMKSEISEMDIKSRIEKVGKDIRKEPVIVLAKTGIVEIDDVLDYMKSECSKKKIDFQLQLSGNIYKMINNYVSKDELEILLADHIKNAIIAIEYSENINKSILVRLGRLDGTYGLYVYDSGIEFEIETFLKLGKKPATTHKDSGGTGMGFMNTFDTLRKHNASFIIEEYGKPVTDNFTKVLKFKFDNKNEFKICTYRKEEIEKQDKEEILNVENLMF